MDTTTDPRTRVAQLEVLIAQHARAQAELAALTSRLLDERLVDPGELMRLHQQARAALSPAG